MQATRLFTLLLVSFVVSAADDSLTAQTITHVPLHTFSNDIYDHNFGRSVGGAGDVNGDGIPDLIIGVEEDDNNGTNSGSARVLSGSDGSVLYNFDGDDTGGKFGVSVSGAGDVNGDGIPDLIVGAGSNFTNRNGYARVLSGSNGSVLYTFNGDDGGDAFGISVSGAGDVNGDGFADLIVGASSDDNNDLIWSGSARVLSGSDGSVLYNFDGNSAGDWFGHSVSDAGDVNGDGFADLIVGAFRDDDFSGSARVLSGSNGSVLYTFNGDSAGDWFGYSVSGAGDVNGDGFADLIVGAPDNNINDKIGGTASVFSGSDGSVLYTFNGDNSGDEFGFSVSGAGDVNGDGFADLIVGARRDDNNGSSSGSARVFSGSDGNMLYTLDGDSSNDTFGWSASGVGDLNGDGIDDFIVGTGGRYARVFVSQIILLGDCNQDDIVDFSDIPAFISILIAGDYLAEADIDQNGVVDFSDIPLFIATLQAS